MDAARVFTLGTIVLLLGIQIRAIDTFVLNEPATRFIQSRTNQPANNDGYDTYSGFSGYDAVWSESATSGQGTSGQLKSITPPRWLGLSLISVGAVLIMTFRCFG